MSVNAIRKCERLRRLAAGALLCGSGALPACATARANTQSTVAQGSYYAAGQPSYDEFFASLFVRQVEMEQAPHVPELQRLKLAHALGLTPRAVTDDVALRLHEEALKLSRSGLRLRLDQSPASDEPEAASAAVRSSGRPKEAATVALLTQVESSASSLLRAALEMKQADAALDDLELAAGGLDASVNQDFEHAPRKADEVKQNLADAHRLIALMKTRAASVGAESEQLLASVAKAVNTDDGSVPAAGAEAEPAPDAAGETKKQPSKPHPVAVKAAHAVAPAPHPKAAALTEQGEAPAKPALKPSNAAAPQRDFEP